MEIVWTTPAKYDLQQIFEYIADDNVNAASKLLNETCLLTYCRLHHIWISRYDINASM